MKYVSLKSTISFPLSSLENNFHVIIDCFYKKIIIDNIVYGLRIQGKNMLNNIQIQLIRYFLKKNNLQTQFLYYNFHTKQYDT